jgi:glycolate oxidase FAD binding subunit
MSAMTTDCPALQSLVDRVRAARADGSRLNIRGGGSKDFYGEAARGEAAKSP